MKELPAGAEEDPDHRRRVLDGRRSRPRARAVRARRRVRRDHDGRRCACERRVWQERQRHRRSLRCHGRVDIQVGTLSKAIGVLGGYVAGSRNLIEFLYHRARPFLFSTSHPPAVTAACLAALDILETEPQWIEKLWDNTRFFKAGLDQLGFNTGMSESPITPVIVGEAATAAKMSDTLFERGVFAQSIGFPTVARDKARLRTIVAATHTKEDLQYALDTFGTVGRELGVICRTSNSLTVDCSTDCRCPSEFFRATRTTSRRRSWGSCSRGKRRRPTASSRAASTPRSSKACRGTRRRRQVRAGLLPRLHDAPVAGAPPDVRRRARVLGDRPAAALRAASA